MSEKQTVALPDIERTEDLLLRALNDGDVALLGWADDSVMQPLNHPVRFTFDVTSAPVGSHEDEVLVLAFRVPHPDEWTLDEVLHGCQHRHGTEEAVVGGCEFTVCSSCGLVDPPISGRGPE